MNGYQLFIIMTKPLHHQFVLRMSCCIGLLLVVAMFGCNSERVRPEGLPSLYPCTISITQEGEPLVGAIVTLKTLGEPLNWTVTGKTDQTGMATIYTDGYFKGVPVGEYKVMVDKVETVVPPLPEVLPTNPLALEKLYNKLEAETKDYRLIEPLYCKVDTTSLSISVEKKKTQVSFDVGKKFRGLAE